VGSGASVMAGGVDFAPTTASLEALAVIEKDVTAVRTDYRNLIEKEIRAFNRSLAGHGITPFTAGVPGAVSNPENNEP